MSKDQVQKLAEDRGQSSAALEDYQKRLLDVKRESQQLRESVEESQSKVGSSRVGVAELQVEVEKLR